MHNIFNTAIAYTDMARLFCKTYSNYQGNVLSNSSFLHNLLASNAIQAEKVDEFPNIDFRPNRNHFSGKYCEECKAEPKPYTNSINQINVREKIIEILIPDYSQLEVDDLYEIRIKANSEIEQLSAYIDEISIAASDEEDLNKLINNKITTSVSELQSKIEGIRLTSLQKALGLRDVAAIPILIELMPNLPAYVPVALSAAFIAIDAGIEIRKEYLQLKQDPLFFTIKLNRLANKHNHKQHRPTQNVIK